MLKNKKVLYIGVITVIALVAALLLVITIRNTNSIRLHEYITVEYKGYDGDGYARLSIDKEKFYIDNISKVKFKNSNAKDAFYALRTDEKEPIDVLFDSVSNMRLERSANLSNGDVIELDFAEEYFQKEYEHLLEFFDIKLVCDPFIVKDLKDIYKNIDEMPKNVEIYAEEELRDYLDDQRLFASNLTVTDIYYYKHIGTGYEMYFIFRTDNGAGEQVNYGVLLYDVYWLIDDPERYGDRYFVRIYTDPHETEVDESVEDDDGVEDNDNEPFGEIQYNPNKAEEITGNYAGDIVVNITTEQTINQEKEWHELVDIVYSRSKNIIDHKQITE